MDVTNLATAVWIKVVPADTVLQNGTVHVDEMWEHGKVSTDRDSNG